MDLDAEETVAERVARLLAHQAGARASSLPDTRRTILQSPRLSAKSDGSAGSDMRSGSQPSKLKLTFANAFVAAPAPVRGEEGTRESRGKEANEQAEMPRGGQGREVAGLFCDATCLRCNRTRVDFPRGCYPLRDWQAGYGKPDEA